jgi:hypothetical protein
MSDGKVRLRSNVVIDGDAWRLVPGDVVAKRRPDLFRSPNRPTHLQRDEDMYYAPCGLCGRTIRVINLEGCDCPDAPKPAQVEAARLRRTVADAALEAARAEVAKNAAELQRQKRSVERKNLDPPIRVPPSDVADGAPKEVETMRDIDDQARSELRPIVQEEASESDGHAIDRTSSSTTVVPFPTFLMKLVALVRRLAAVVRYR